jgi:hypothetical protein
MKTNRLKITTMDDIMNYKAQRRFTYYKDGGGVVDNDGRGYFATDHGDFIRLLHHLSGRKMDLEPIYDLLNQYVHDHDLV